MMRDGRIVIVGASLAGLRAAEHLRDAGFVGSLTLVGDEAHEPYDRPPLSKQVLLGQVLPEHTALPGRVRSTRSGGSASPPPGWTATADGCSWSTVPRSSTTGC